MVCIRDYFCDYIFICRQPSYRPHILGQQPLGCLMFPQPVTRFRQPASEAMHCQVELRIVVIDGPQQLAHFNLRIQLLAYLALECRLFALTGFYLPSRKLPPVLPVAIAPLRGKYPPLGIIYHRRHYFYCSHRVPILFSLISKPVTAYPFHHYLQICGLLILSVLRAHQHVIAYFFQMSLHLYRIYKLPNNAETICICAYCSAAEPQG